MQKKEMDTAEIKTLLKERKPKLKLMLKICAHCGLCADSCFLYRTRGKLPEYMPSHKFINSIGTLYKKKGKVSEAEMNEIKDIVWERCVLCTRCYCPLGIDIPDMIAWGRTICRSQNVVYDFTKEENAKDPATGNLLCTEKI